MMIRSIQIALFLFFTCIACDNSEHEKEEIKLLNDSLLEIVGTDWYTNATHQFFLPPKVLLARFYTNPRMLNWADSAYYPFPFSMEFEKYMANEISLIEFENQFNNFIEYYTDLEDSSKLIVYISDSLIYFDSTEINELIKSIDSTDWRYKELLINGSSNIMPSRYFLFESLSNTGRYNLTNKEYLYEESTIPDYLAIIGNPRYDNKIEHISDNKISEKHIGHFNFSRILFDKDFKIALCTVEFYHDPLFSYKELVLFIKKNGQWVIHNRNILWLS